MTEDREFKNQETLAERARTMKKCPKFFLTISICLAFSTAAFAGCKKDTEEPQPEVTTGAEAPPPEPEPVQSEQVRCEPETVYFAFDSAELDGTARATIQEAVECFRGQGLQGGLMLTGACDPRGTEEYNIALGERRASAVREYMRSLGLNSSRVSITSVGEEMATGTDEASWAQDRNVTPSAE